MIPLFGACACDNSDIDMFKRIGKIKKAGGNLIQIFYNDGKQYNVVKLKHLLKKNKMRIVIHSSYKNNLSKDWDRYSVSINNIIDEIEFANSLNALGVVFHTGKQLNFSRQRAYNNMFTALLHIHTRTKEYSNVKLFIETPSGQGTETLHKLEDLSYFYNKFKTSSTLFDRVSICIDTCHIFSAGYDIRTKKDIIKYLDKFNHLIGLENIGLIHLNDSSVELGSRVDRHQSIGKGYIGYSGLKHFFIFFMKMRIPIVLETPSRENEVEIKRLLAELDR